MPKLDVSVPTPDGTCPAALLVPDGEGPWPAVIMFPDAGGLRPTFHAMGQRLADFGYVVLVPDPYYRHGPYEPFDMKTAFGDEAERNRLMGLARSVTKEMVARDAGAFLDFLAAQPQVAGTAVGTTGYCMGGGSSLTAAAHHPDRVAAAASFHGGYLATDAPDSPHTVVDRIRGRVYIAAAENDGSFPPEQAAKLEEALQKGGVDYQLETYPAAHGFAVPDNPTHDPEAEERHWRALAELYGATLKAS
ncbi:MAG TPA: dienelactone hydrolase family protein [Acidimicrobiales bacterium]